MRVKAALSGRFRLTTSKNGVFRKSTGWFGNTILDAGLDMIGTVNTYLDCVQVGSGNTAPAPEQTTLVTFVAGTDNRTAANSGANNASPYGGFSQILWRFNAGEVVGVIREVGVGPSALTGSTLFSRTLVPDTFGVTTEVEVLDDEDLDVEYQLTVSPSEVDDVSVIDVSGVETTVTARASLVSTAQHLAPYRSASYASSGQAVRATFSATPGTHAVVYEGAIGAITSSPGGDSAQAGVISTITYVPGSYEINGVLDIAPTAANFDDGIRSVSFRFAPGTGDGGNSLGQYQVEFTPPLAKNENLSLGIDVTVSWGRA